VLPSGTDRLTAHEQRTEPSLDFNLDRTRQRISGIGAMRMHALGHMVVARLLKLYLPYSACLTMLYDGGENGRNAADRAALQLCHVGFPPGPPGRWGLSLSRSRGHRDRQHGQTATNAPRAEMGAGKRSKGET
jgi:hypothetical protein